MAGNIDQQTGSRDRQTESQSQVLEIDSLTGTLSPAWILAYLAVFGVWRQLVPHPYSLAILRLLFLISIAAVLCARRNWSALHYYFVGKHGFDLCRLRTTVLMIILMIATQMAIESVWPIIRFKLEARSFVNDILLAPINEELFYRGVCLGILLEHVEWNKAAAVLVVTLLFAGMHQLAGWVHFLRLMFPGLVLALTYVKTRSVPVCILVHMTWNLTAYCPFIHPAKPGEHWQFYMPR